MTPFPSRSLTRSLLALPLAGLLALAGCAADEAAEDESTPAAEDTQNSDATAEALVLQDGWVKATEDPMTGVFGTLHNPGEEDVTLVGAEQELAGRTELHVTVDDGAGGRVMQEADGGFTVPAGGEHVLEPGGDHLMLMELSGPIANGDVLTLTLLTEDGQEIPVEIAARHFDGAEETYAPGGHGDMDGQGDHEDHTDDASETSR